MTKFRIDLTDAPWSKVTGVKREAQQMFGTKESGGTSATLPAAKSERPTLGEVLYRALVEPCEAMS